MEHKWNTACRSVETACARSPEWCTHTGSAEGMQALTGSIIMRASDSMGLEETALPAVFADIHPTWTLLGHQGGIGSITNAFFGSAARVAGAATGAAAGIAIQASAAVAVVAGVCLGCLAPCRGCSRIPQQHLHCINKRELPNCSWGQEPTRLPQEGTRISCLRKAMLLQLHLPRPGDTQDVTALLRARWA